MSKFKFVIIIFMLVCIAGSSFGQVTVTSDFPATALAQKLAGPGIIILNPVLTCPAAANGIFRSVVSNLGLDSGILLTTGRAVTDQGGIGVNGGAFNHASTSNNAPGDPSLEPLAGQATRDACSLEFDVIPQGDTLKFDYVFGSEEYINATCGPYNDAFAFFISGPGIAGMENMALVPRTNIPVTINSINSGVPGPNYSISGCNRMGPGSPFTNYFISNTAGGSITYEGFTKVLSAYHAVIPCNAYHLKMVIADGGNFLYDSGVFIKAGSLQANTLSVEALSADTTIKNARAFAVKNCAPGFFRIRRAQAKRMPETVRFVIDGNAINGYDYQQIADSILIPAGQIEAILAIHGLATPANGPKQVKLLIKKPNNCNGVTIADSASLTLLDTLSARIKTRDTIICKGEKVLLQAEGDTMLIYQWSPTYLLQNAFEKTAVAVPLSNTIYGLNASFPKAGCTAKTDSVLVEVLPVPEVMVMPLQRACLHSNFTFSAIVKPAYNGYSYAWIGPNGFAAYGQDPQLRNILLSDAGRYLVRVGLDTNRCAGEASFTLDVIETKPPLTENITLCEGKPTTALDAQGIQLSWYTSTIGGVGTKEIIPQTGISGTKIYYVSQTAGGCESGRTPLKVDVKPCCDIPLFIPTAFTPNGDGKNDYFKPQLSGYGNNTVKLRIYNRWGQMVFESFTSKGWDGRWNNMEAGPGTYFYEAVVNCKQGGQQLFKGDVVLIR